MDWDKLLTFFLSHHLVFYFMNKNENTLLFYLNKGIIICYFISYYSLYKNKVLINKLFMVGGNETI